MLLRVTLLGWLAMILLAGCGDSGDDDVDNGSDADADADSDGDSDSDSDADADADADTDSDADTDADSDADGDTDGDADSDADTDADGDADGDTDTDSDTDSDSDSDSDTDPDVDECYICDFSITEPECACPGTAECDQIKACNANPSGSGCDGILQRKAVFDDLRRLSMEREAFTPKEQHSLQLDYEKDSAEMEPFFVAGDTELGYFRALYMMNNVRRDSHLDISNSGGPWINTGSLDERQAPIRFLPDYGEPAMSYAYFVIGYDASGLDGEPDIGDRLVSINGEPIHCVGRWLQLFRQCSSYYQCMWRTKDKLEEWSELYNDGFMDPGGITYVLRRSDGTEYTLEGEFSGKGKKYDYGVEMPEPQRGHKVPGFEPNPVLSKTNYALYLPNDDKTVLYLEWLDFEDPMEQEMQDLVEYADDNGLLDYDLIVDATHSSGGSDGILALRRLTDTPFLCTFGNVRVSEASEWFADGHSSWLRNDVEEAQQNGWDYTVNRPFKMANSSAYDDDGIVAIPSLHFTGRSVWLVFPSGGGSHLDQFAAMAIDNEMGHSIGVSSPGYSNTWEWREDYLDPTTGEDVMGWMWNIGHTIRPNEGREVLQGNPALAVEQVPMTPENYQDYYDDLVLKALEHLGY